MLLNNQQITEEIKDEIKHYIETNGNKNVMTENLWDEAKAVLRGKFIQYNHTLRNNKISNNVNSHFSSVQFSHSVVPNSL